MQLKTCKVCDKQVKRKDKVFCSTKCYYSTRTGARNNKWKGGKLTITCKSCSKVFHVDRDRADAKTCSQVCNKQYRKSEEFRMTASKRARKQILEQYGETPKFITKLEQIIRESAKYRLWRQQVWERDGYTCVLCTKKGKVCADHIVSFLKVLLEEKVESYDQALESKRLWDVSNGRTLCYDCHYKTENYGFRAIKQIN